MDGFAHPPHSVRTWLGRVGVGLLLAALAGADALAQVPVAPLPPRLMGPVPTGAPPVQRALELPPPTPMQVPAIEPLPIPPDYEPWWQDAVMAQLKRQSSPLAMNLDNVVLGTLMHSPQVRVLSDTPIIRQTAVT